MRVSAGDSAGGIARLEQLWPWCPRVLRGTAGAVMRTADRCGSEVEGMAWSLGCGVLARNAGHRDGTSHARERSTERDGGQN